MNTEDMVIVLDGEGKAAAVLENAFNIIAADEVNGAGVLDFDIYFTDSKRKYLDNEVLVRLKNTVYKVKNVADDKQSKFMRQTHVYAENLFYGLARASMLQEAVFDIVPPTVPMGYALQGTEWSVGIVEITTARSFLSSENNPLALLRLIADIYNGEIDFRSDTKMVDLKKRIGSDNGVVFTFEKNMTSAERIMDTSSLITRLYATGADGITFSDVNGGLPYVENHTYSDEVLVGTLDCSSMTDKQQMLDFTKMRLADYANPRYSYRLTVMSLGRLPEYTHEEFSLGDTVRVFDSELGINFSTRIVRLERNIREPWNTSVELSTTVKTLSQNTDDSMLQAINSVVRSFVAPRLMQATINVNKGEINAMYELGIPVKYTFEETENGIIFRFPDGKDCEIVVIGK